MDSFFRLVSAVLDLGGPKIYGKDRKIRGWRDQFRALKLSESDVARLHRVFTKIDKDGSGSLELWEVLDHLDLSRTRFAKRVFSIFDADGSNEIDFREFVVTLWQFCTLGRTQLVLFAFDLYDRDSSGEIDLEELSDMLKELYGDRYAQSGTATHLLRHIRALNSRGGDEHVTLATFQTFVRTHPALLAPAFIMQQTLRARVLGARWWDRKSQERVTVAGRSVHIRAVLEAHLSERNFHTLMDVVKDDTPGGAAALAADAKRHATLFGADDLRTLATTTGLTCQRRKSLGLKGVVHPEVVDKYSRPGLPRTGSKSANGGSFISLPNAVSQSPQQEVRLLSELAARPSIQREHSRRVSPLMEVRTLPQLAARPTIQREHARRASLSDAAARPTIQREHLRRASLSQTSTTPNHAVSGRARSRSICSAKTAAPPVTAS